MKQAAILLLLAFGWLPSFASAMCYTVYDRTSWIIYRSILPPIDLSGSISQAMRAKFPGGQLVISDDMRLCTDIDPVTKVNPLAGEAVARK
jgi:hypothetical protein